MSKVPVALGMLPIRLGTDAEKMKQHKTLERYGAHSSDLSNARESCSLQLGTSVDLFKSSPDSDILSAATSG